MLVGLLGKNKKVDGLDSVLALAEVHRRITIPVECVNWNK